MSITVNGQSSVPPGFRFHPTEEELLNYYLRKKVACDKMDLDVICDVDLNKLEPWDIQEECKIGTTPQNDWYFFSHKDKKYPTGTRTNRATAAGFWKATGRDKVIYAGVGRIGMRKTLVFYKGRAPHGQKSEWIMHEYRLDDHLISGYATTGLAGDVAANQEDGWVVCRVFKKKNVIVAGSSCQQKSFDVANCDGALRQILHHLGRPFKEESTATGSETTKLPALQSPTPLPWLIPDEDCARREIIQAEEPLAGIISYDGGAGGSWSALDRFITSDMDHANQIPSFEDAEGLSGVLCAPPPSFFAVDYYQLHIGDACVPSKLSNRSLIPHRSVSFGSWGGVVQHH